MAVADKTFRVFVSSTFSDLKAEREALQERVFPRLRDLCTAHGAHFQAIDLRWGVSQEASLDQQTMNICLAEIKRCQQVTPRPNFIVLLSDRYGWCPLPAQIDAAEFEEMLEEIPPADKGLLVWNDRQTASQKGWYRRDDNAVPPAYCLRPRELDIPDDAGDEEEKTEIDREAQEWGQVENKLRSTVLQAIEALGWQDDDPRRIKYEASATHQEIIAGALGASEASQQAFCFFRTITGIPFDRGNGRYDPKAKNFVDMDTEKKPELGVNEKLLDLKTELHGRLPTENVFEYQVEWSSTDHIELFCEDVYRSLEAVIRTEIGEIQAQDELDKEVEDHQNFGIERAEFFTGREAMLDIISDYITGPDPHPLVIYGEGGTGKSALLAYALKQAREDQPKAQVIYRFIGATASSSDKRALLESLCRQITREYGGEEKVPYSWEDLVEDFPKRLVLATKDKPLILFIDSLDQLSHSHNARNLNWLPREIPENVRLVISTRPGDELTILCDKLSAEKIVELGPMSSLEGEELLDKWLGASGRTLQYFQKEEVLLGFKACGNPLYLKMAFEEVRRWHSFAEDIALNSDVQGVIRDLYQRLSDEKHHGRTFASRALGYLAAGRYGLAEDEIIDILSQDREVMADFKRRSPKSPEVERLPVAVWSRFYFDIKPYLMERISEDTTLLAFYHLELHDVAKEDYLVKDNQGVERHGALAEYFNKQAGPRARDYQDEQSERDRWSGRPRSLSELPYHAAAAKMWDELFAVLTDFRFLENKAERVNVTELRDPRSGMVKAHGGAFNLQEDYERALAAYPASDQRKSLEIFSRCFNREIHNFRQRSDILWQQLYNRMQWADDSAYPEIISKLLGTEFDRRSRSKAEPWLHLVNPVLEPESLLRTIVGHTNYINACAFSPDGKRVVSGGHGGIIKVWEVTTGKELHDLTGKLYHVYGICFSPDGKYIVAGSQGRIEVLDLVTQKSLLSIDNAGDVSSCVFRPPGGDVLAVATGDDSLKLWDMKTGKLLSTMKYHPHTYNPNGQLMILTKDDRRPSILNLDTSKRVVLEAYIMENPLQEEPWEHAWGVPWQRPYAFSSDGKVIAIISRLQNRVMVWATQTGHLLGNLEGQPLCLFACAAGPDGVLVLLALHTSDDLRLWNVTTGKLIRFTGHVKRISSCDFSPDGKLFVSASWDWTVKLWDIETGSRKYAQHNPPTLGETKARERLEQCMAEGWKRWCFVCCEEKSSYQVELNLILGGGLFGKDSVQNFTIRDIETGESITTEGGHPTSPVYSLALCPKKGILASVGLDRFLKIWDFRSGRNIAAFPALAGLSRVDFIRDGLLIRCEEETQGRVYFLRLFGMENQERCDCCNKILLWSYGEIGRLHGLYARHLVQMAQAGKITMKEFSRVSSLKGKLGLKIWYYDQLVRAAAWYMENLHQALLLENREEIERLISEHKSKAARNVRDRKGVATSLAIAAFLLDRKLGRHNAALELAQEAYGVSAKYGGVQLGRFIKPILELLRSKAQ